MTGGLRRLLGALAGAAGGAVLTLPLAAAAGAVDLFTRRGTAGLPDPVRPIRSLDVVIPSHQGRDLLPSCLAAARSALDLLASERSISGKIIVSDDASTDGTAEWLGEDHPEVLCVPSEGRGFSAACNAGARASRADVVVMLNNDMVVDERALLALVDGFARPTVWATTAQIFFTDPAARRQETGLTWTRFRHGRVQVSHAQPPDFLTRPAPVAWGGGGSTAYDRGLFLALGGFDELFSPFYWEDFDIAQRAWSVGYETLYVPQATVIHAHRATIGRLFGADDVARIVSRNGILRDWAGLHDGGWWARSIAGLPLRLAQASAECGQPGKLIAELAGRLGEAMRARARRRRQRVAGDAEVAAYCHPGAAHRDRFASSVPPGPPRVLWVTPYSPYPPSHGGAVRMWCLAAELSRAGAPVHLLSFIEGESERVHADALADVFASVELVSRPKDMRRWRRRSRQARFFFEFEDEEFARLLGQLVHQHEIDVVQLEYTQMGQYAQRSRTVATCLTEHDLASRSMFRAAGSGSPHRLRVLQELVKTLPVERALCETADVVFSVSPDEGRLIGALAPGATVNDDVPTGVDTTLMAPPEGSSGSVGVAAPDSAPAALAEAGQSVLFVGYFAHHPNVDAADWLISDIWPRIREAHPGARLRLAGRAAPKWLVRKHACRLDVEFLGFVDDIREVYEAADVVVAPIRYGAGVRVKLFESLSCEAPTVATSLAAEGIPVEHGVHLRIADDADSFAREVVELLGDAEEAARLAAAGRRLMVEHFDWSRSAEALARVYEELTCARSR
jgi:GT2 family glycosyltransferase/glycosyltransferase involved in cell wall biosynthesis